MHSYNKANVYNHLIITHIMWTYLLFPRSMTNRSAQKVTADAKAALRAKHGEHSDLLFNSVYFHNDTLLINKMAHRIVHQKPFTIGVMGTSVTAGHDNFFYQSFSMVWGRLMNDSFSAAGSPLIMRNHAMGWNPIYPRYIHRVLIYHHTEILILISLASKYLIQIKSADISMGHSLLY